MIGASSEEGSARWAGVGDLAPYGLLLAFTLALDLALVHARGTLVGDGGASDVALALSGVSTLATLGLPAALRRGGARRSGIKKIDVMTGAEFEERLAALYRAMGYRVSHTGQRGDFGADLVVQRAMVRTAVQAKRYQGAVGIDAVQQALGAAQYYDCAGAAVVTNSTCTPAARSLASASGVELVERDVLVDLLAAHAPRPTLAGVAAAFVVQLADGMRVCAFAAGVAVRMAWWLARLLARLVARSLRTVWRGAG